MAIKMHFNAFREFIRSGSLGGIFLLACVAISLFLANSSLHTGFENLLATQIGFSNNSIDLRYPVLQWINDGLMAIFFLLVGLEIKRELLDGELSSVRHAILPVFAAIGGAITPAIIYWIFNRGTSTAQGWGIPMATDIAFALAILGLLGKKVPASLKIFLAALAIVDDLIAILVIAVFYSAELHFSYLLYGAGIIGFMIIINLAKVNKLVFYLLPGLLLWYCIHHSGIHAAIAGVLTAMVIPANPGKDPSPLEILEHALSKPVNYLIMPVFALANTNIRFEYGMIGSLYSAPGLGIMAGLLIGKPVGITMVSWMVVKAKLASLPSHASWKHITGIGLLGGIGFTMSIFIAILSFQEISLQTNSKFAILVTSAIAALAGFLLLSGRKKRSRLPMKAA
jgi:NhaA family Na+:H+ antiporter